MPAGLVASRAPGSTHSALSLSFWWVAGHLCHSLALEHPPISAFMFSGVLPASESVSMSPFDQDTSHVEVTHSSYPILT